MKLRRCLGALVGAVCCLVTVMWLGTFGPSTSRPYSMIKFRQSINNSFFIYWNIVKTANRTKGATTNSGRNVSVLSPTELATGSPSSTALASSGGTVFTSTAATRPTVDISESPTRAAKSESDISVHTTLKATTVSTIPGTKNVATWSSTPLVSTIKSSDIPSSPSATLPPSDASGKSQDTQDVASSTLGETVTLTTKTSGIQTVSSAEQPTADPSETTAKGTQGATLSSAEQPRTGTSEKSAERTKEASLGSTHRTATNIPPGEHPTIPSETIATSIKEGATLGAGTTRISGIETLSPAEEPVGRRADGGEDGTRTLGSDNPTVATKKSSEVQTLPSAEVELPPVEAFRDSKQEGRPTWYSGRAVSPSTNVADDNSATGKQPHTGQDATETTEATTVNATSATNPTSTSAMPVPPGIDPDVYRHFKRRELKPSNKAMILDLLQVFTRVADARNWTYFIIGGTLIGSLRHWGMIPWDDDVDVAVNISHHSDVLASFKKLEPNYTVFERSYDPILKFFSNDSYRCVRPSCKFRWPLMDIIFFKEDDDYIWQHHKWFKKYRFRKTDVFPLHKRPFEGMMLNAPKCGRALMKIEHVSDIDEVCATADYGHDVEGKTRKTMDVPCEKFKNIYPLVFRRDINGTQEETLKLGNRTLDIRYIQECVSDSFSTRRESFSKRMRGLR